MVGGRLRRAVLGAVLRGTDAIVVASFGRAGSTLVADAIVEARARRSLGPLAKRWERSFHRYQTRLHAPSLTPGVVHKTHDYPEALVGRPDVRCVFIFGGATVSALSVARRVDALGPEWWRRHADNLRADAEFEELFTRDALGFEAQCRRWFSFGGAPTLCLRYETLWDNETRLSEFVDAPLRLPQRRPRATSLENDADAAAAKAVYGELDRALDEMPDCFLAGPKRGAAFRERLAGES